MIRRPPRSTHCISSAASDVYKRQILFLSKTGAEYWDTDSKQAIAQKLVRRISDYFSDVHVSGVQKKENI